MTVLLSLDVRLVWLRVIHPRLNSITSRPTSPPGSYRCINSQSEMAVYLEERFLCGPSSEPWVSRIVRIKSTCRGRYKFRLWHALPSAVQRASALHGSTVGGANETGTKQTRASNSC